MQIYNTLIALAVIGLQLAIVVGMYLWLIKAPIMKLFYKHVPVILATLFIGAAAASLVYEYRFGYEPCLLCWYQRIAIFGIAILSLSGNIKTNRTLQKQILAFSILGIIVALFHNYIDLVPGSTDVCGAGPSCLKRYVYEFGYITIPMMSLTILTAGAFISWGSLHFHRRFDVVQ